MKIEEHRRRAEVYRAAAEEHEHLDGGMCLAIAEVLGDWHNWDDQETLPFRLELGKEVGRLSRFHKRMNGTYKRWANPDRVLIRGEILTRAAEYHEACVAAGRTL